MKFIWRTRFCFIIFECKLLYLKNFKVLTIAKAKVDVYNNLDY